MHTECGDDEVRLLVRDEGAGFDPTAGYAGHLGLGTMRERADAVGGEVVVHSAPGAGTTVVLTLPTNSSVRDRSA